MIVCDKCKGENANCYQIILKKNINNTSVLLNAETDLCEKCLKDLNNILYNFLPTSWQESKIREENHL